MTTLEEDSVSSDAAAAAVVAKNDNKGGTIVAMGGMEAMLAAAIAKRKERKQLSEAPAARSNEIKNESKAAAKPLRQQTLLLPVPTRHNSAARLCLRCHPNPSTEPT